MEDKIVEVKIVLDRFEGEYAILEVTPGQILEVPRNQLPAAAKEGDCLIIVNGQYQRDAEQTAQLKKEITDLAKDLWE